jgi:hypothetical protein
MHLMSIPGFVFIIGNIAIILRLRKYHNEITGESSGTTAHKSQMRLTITAISLSMMHLVLTLPAVLINFVVDTLHFKQTNGTILQYSLSLMVQSNYAFNILVYFATSKLFRKELKILSCCFRNA